MADLVLTAAQITLAGGTQKKGIAGATLAAGDTLYKDTAAADTLKLFDANGAGDLRKFAGVALHGAAAGQPIAYAADDGELTLTTGADVATIGNIIIGSATPGKMCPHADLATGHFANILGWMKTGKILKLAVVISDVALG